MIILKANKMYHSTITWRSFHLDAVNFNSTTNFNSLVQMWTILKILVKQP